MTLMIFFCMLDYTWNHFPINTAPGIAEFGGIDGFRPKKKKKRQLNPQQSVKEFRTRHSSYLIKHTADLSLALMSLREGNHINICPPRQPTFGTTETQQEKKGKKKRKANHINEPSELCLRVLLKVWTQTEFGVSERKPAWEWDRFRILTHGSHYLFTTVLLCTVCGSLLTLPLYFLRSLPALFLSCFVFLFLREVCSHASDVDRRVRLSRCAIRQNLMHYDTVSEAHPSCQDIWWHSTARSDVSLWNRTFCMLSKENNQRQLGEKKTSHCYHAKANDMSWSVFFPLLPYQISNHWDLYA